MRLFPLAFAVAISWPLQVNAAEIKVLCVGGVESAISILIPQFERASGHKVSVTYVSPARALRDRVLSESDVDVALVPSPVIADVERAGKIVPRSRVEISRTPLAVGIRAGAARPDLSRTDAVRKSVLAAKIIALADQSGIHFIQVADRFGFGPELKSRMKLIQGGGVAVATAVANGEADMAVTLMSEIPFLAAAARPRRVWRDIHFASAHVCLNADANYAHFGRNEFDIIQAPGQPFF